MRKRIVTRPDFDGVVCAVLLKEALGVHIPVKWAQPNEMQAGQVEILANDIIANLPFHPKCLLWFDHHYSNAHNDPFKGLFKVAPSAAGLVYEYYQNQIDSRYNALSAQADKIDSADLTLDEILHPQQYPCVLMAMSISMDMASSLDYCDHLVHLLRTRSIEEVLNDPLVQSRGDQVVAENQAYEKHLLAHTTIRAGVSFTDFRSIDPVSEGNRFLVYSLFPETVVNVKVFNEGDDTIVKVGCSILNRNCHVNIGKLLVEYNGGGHLGVGGCRLPRDKAEADLARILKILEQNRPIT